MQRYILLSVFVAALTVYAVAGKATNGKATGTPPGKNPCVGAPRENRTCDMHYWSGICVDAFDKQNVPGHQICRPHCGAAPVLTADNVDAAQAAADYDWDNAYGGATLTVQCADGYSPSEGSDMTIQCVNGHWSSFTGKCLKVCANPESATLTNMQMTTDTTGQTFTVGDRLEYECDPNHVAFGCSYAVCQADGTWDTVGDGCTAVCAAPASDYFSNAGPPASISPPYLEGTVVPYTCDSNYSPQGTLTATCTNGAFTYSSGSCVADCGSPPSLPPYTSISGWDGATTAGTTIQLQCEAGYESATAPSFVCDDASPPATWQQYGDACSAIQDVEEETGCSDPPGSGFSPSSDGNTATFTCPDGTLLIINCEGSSWGTTSDTCPDTSTGCGSPPAAGDVTGATSGPTLNADGDVATYGCDTAESVQTTAQAICVDGVWVIQNGGCQSVYEECGEDVSALGVASHVNKCQWFDNWCYCVFEPTKSHPDGLDDCEAIGAAASPPVASQMVAIPDQATYKFVNKYGHEVINGINKYWFVGEVNQDGNLIDGHTDQSLAYTAYAPTSYAAGTCGVLDTTAPDTTWLFTDCGVNFQNQKQKTICQIRDPRP